MNKLSFNQGWSCNGVPVTLPHDAQITESRAADASNSGHGYFPGGIYTYEKRFTAPEEWNGKVLILEFEGVYKNARVRLNGEELCFHPYGYTNFFVELKGLKPNVENTLSVVADNSMLPNSRWYSGSGIYQDGKQNTAASGKPQKAKKQQNASLAFNIMASFIGSGMNKGGNSKKVDELTTPFLDCLDIAGYNYGSGRYPLEEKAHPNRVIFGSETFPQDIFRNWEMIKKYPYLIGDFMWTGWDYLGEAGLGAWSYTGGMPFNRPYPWLLGGAGVIDILGNPDGSCKYASTVWGLEENPVIAVKPVNHPGVRPSKSVWRGTNAVLSWSWAGCRGNKAEVEVYSDQTQVELLINGKSFGIKPLMECKAIFNVKYQPGTLTAVAYDASGRETGRSELRSADAPLQIALRPEKERVKPGDIVYIPVRLEGENGIVECNADRKLTVRVEGGELLAFGSANPCTEEQYHTGSFTTYYGRALAIVRAGEADGLTITATDGDKTGTAQLPMPMANCPQTSAQLMPRPRTNAATMPTARPTVCALLSAARSSFCMRSSAVSCLGPSCLTYLATMASISLWLSAL